jgi:hypothetical protein
MVYPDSKENILQLLVDQVIMEGHGLPWLQGGYIQFFKGPSCSREDKLF